MTENLSDDEWNKKWKELADINPAMAAEAYRFDQTQAAALEKDEFKQLAKEEQAKYRANLKEYFTTEDPKRKMELLGEIGAIDPEIADRLRNSDIRAARAVAGGGGGESEFLPPQNTDTPATNGHAMGTGGGTKPWSTKPGAAG